MFDSIRAAALAAVAAVTVIVPWASAQAAPFQPSVTILSVDSAYDVKADGTYTVEVATKLRIDTDQGVKAHSQLPLSYSTSLQEMEVLEAYTTTKNGQRIDVAPDKIMIQQSPQSRNAPMFDDAKVKTVVFPGVEIGATLDIRFRKTQKQALFPGHFSIVEVASGDSEYKSRRVSLRAPASLKLYVDAVDMPGGQVETDAEGKQLWRWSIEDRSAHAPETGSVGPFDRSPRVAVTTFPSYEAVGVAYLDRAKSKAAVTPAIQQRADEITQGITNRREQAVALYHWVSKQIRYVAIFLDFGGVVPHDAQSILDAKYGDCKDHTTLLEALLAAKGIKSSSVLVNAGTTYWLPKVAVAPGVFNHAISYLPEFDLYLDSTAGVATFATLPIAERGKAALLTDDSSGKPKIVTLPLASADNDRVNVATKLVVDEEGNLTGTSEVRSKGIFDWVSRAVFASVQPGLEAQLASRALSLSGQNGTGDYQHGDVRDLGEPFVYTSQFKLPAYAQLPGPGAMAVPQGLGSFSGIAAAFEPFNLERRDYSMPYIARHVTETISISLPATAKVPTLPKPAKVSSPLGTYEASYSADGQSITVRRDLVLKTDKPLVQPAEYPALRAMAQAVTRDLRTQLIY